ncbi:MAG: type I-E CRISPR-associated protein Cas5/CasD [Candidatus Ancillula sp.]|nr:type I-E CRISPR-associated protein Cas5/CasD [Candidatus Ancillula sp.]
MSNTLLLRLAAPMQSWGSSSKFNMRSTQREPTKSGVIGMIASALGRGRDEDLTDLCKLKFGVRIDQVGKVQREYQTAKKWLPKEQKYSTNKNDAFKSTRYFLSDAVFLVGLDGDLELLKDIEHALKNPVFPIGLGRRAYIPELPLVLRCSNKSLLEALKTEAWQAKEWYQKRTLNEFTRRQNNFENADEKVNDFQDFWLEIVHDVDAALDKGDGISNSFMSHDLPVSFSQEHRKYALRSIVGQVHGVKISELEGPNKSTKEILRADLFPVEVQDEGIVSEKVMPIHDVFALIDDKTKNSWEE